MPLISQETIEEVKERANIMDVVSESVSLKRQGSGFVGLCPFHSEKTPSFHIRERDNSYHCFGCGESGSVITFVMKEKGFSYPEAIEYLAQRFGVDVKHESGRSAAKGESAHKKEIARANTLAQEYFRSCLSAPPKEVKEYVIGRGLRGKAIEAFGIGFCPRAQSGEGLVARLRKSSVSDAVLVSSGLARRSKSGDLYDAYSGRLIFPIFQEGGQIVGFGGRIIPSLFSPEWVSSSPKYINSPENPLYHKSRTLYGLPQALEAIRRSGEVYLVEGYMDVVGLWQAGVRNVAASCGTALTDGHLKRLSRMASKIFVLFDGDRAGRVAAAKSFPLFSNAEVDGWAVFLPDEEDPDSFARQKGKDTGSELSAIERSSLLECYIDWQVQRANFESVKDLGAAAAEKIARDVAKILARIERPVQREKLAEQAAYRLMVDAATLTKMIEGSPETPKRTQEEDESSPGELIAIKSAASLPRLDRELLLAVMVHRDELVERVLRDPEIATSLDPSTMAFVQGLDAAISSGGESSVREQIKELLKSLDGSWFLLWRQAHEMSKQKGADLRKTFEECVSALDKRRLNQRFTELDKRIAGCSDEAEKAMLYQEKLSLARRLKISAETDMA